jgi:hypothetical protein
VRKVETLRPARGKRRQASERVIGLSVLMAGVP